VSTHRYHSTGENEGSRVKIPSSTKRKVKPALVDLIEAKKAMMRAMVEEKESFDEDAYAALSAEVRVMEREIRRERMVRDMKREEEDEDLRPAMMY